MDSEKASCCPLFSWCGYFHTDLSWSIGSIAVCTGIDNCSKCWSAYCTESLEGLFGCSFPSLQESLEMGFTLSALEDLDSVKFLFANRKKVNGWTEFLDNKSHWSSTFLLCLFKACLLYMHIKFLWAVGHINNHYYTCFLALFKSGKSKVKLRIFWRYFNCAVFSSRISALVIYPPLLSNSSVSPL